MGYWPKRTGTEHEADRSRSEIPAYREPEARPTSKTLDVSSVGQITSDDVLPMEAWERQPEETGPAWEAFQAYRDLGPGRTIPLTRQALSSDDEIRAASSSRIKENGKLQKWAHKYNWEVRALAYDKMIDQKRVEEHIEAAKEMTRRHIKLSQMIQERGQKRLEKMKDAEIAKLKPVDAAKLIGQGVDMERLAMGQPTSQSKSIHTGKIEHGGDNRAVKEVREFKKSLMEKLDDIERKRTNTQQIISDHKAPTEEDVQDALSKNTIRKELLPHIVATKDHRTN